MIQIVRITNNHMATKKKKIYVTKEGSKCHVCNKGKVVYNKNKGIIPTMKNTLCDNPECERYCVCQSCGEFFGNHK